MRIVVESIDATVLAGVEAGAMALGRLDATLAVIPGSLKAAAVARCALVTFPGNPADVNAMLAPRGEASGPAIRYHAALSRLASTEEERLADAVASALADAGVGADVAANAGDIASALGDPLPTASGVVAAAVLAGMLFAPAASSRRAEAAAGLAAAAVLVGRGLISAPWVCALRLDAQARSAAVQLDRSGQWSAWLDTFSRGLVREADAVRGVALGAAAAFESDLGLVRARRRVGATDAAVLESLQRTPRLTIPDASRALGLTPPTVGAAVARLEADNLAVEVTGRRRDRVWVAAGAHALAATG